MIQTGRAQLALWAIGALLSVGSIAEARSPASAKDLLDEAIVRYSLAKFDASLKLLRRARRVARRSKRLGKIFLYLGLNRVVLGPPAKARAAFRQALIYDPRLALDPRAHKKSTLQMFDGVRDQLKGKLVLRAARAGATVVVDGVERGRAPVSLPLVVGPHRVEVRGGAGVTYRTTVLIAYERTHEIDVELVKVAAPPPPPPPRPKSRRRRRLWTWVAAGAAALALGAGIGLGAAASSAYSECEELGAAGQDRSRWEDVRASGRSKALAANVLFGVSAALAITSAALFFLEGRARGSGARARSVLLTSLAGRGAGLALDGSF